tara:strand:- start:1223 stop:1429 length:207 start_codon:yes stop_codon:yes gene_type:complete
MKRRTRQQLVDPWSIPPTEPIEVFVVEETDNITEEIEYTLEQLTHAYNLSEEERDEIWSDHKKGDNDE